MSESDHARREWRLYIGEAAAQIPETVRDAHPEIPWRAIVGMRTRLAHACPSVDDDVVRTVIVDAVPALLPALRKPLDTWSRE